MYTRSPQASIPRLSTLARHPATVVSLSGILTHSPSMKGTCTKLFPVALGGRFWVTFLHRVAASALTSLKLIERPEPLVFTWEAKSDFNDPSWNSSKHVAG